LTLKDANNAIDIGSRCFDSDRFTQLAGEAEESCTCYRMNQEAISQVPDDYPRLPYSADLEAV